MSWELVLILGVLTYGSRAVALTLLPPMPPPVAAVLDRMPPALFAGLAMQALLSPSTGLAEAPILAAAAGALVVAPRRSLPACLVAGTLAYFVASALI